MKNAKLKITNEEWKTKSALLVFLFTFLIFNFASPVLAHEGKPHKLGDLWYTWGRDPFIIAGLALMAWLYWRGLRRVWRESVRGRERRRFEAWAFIGGWLALFVALVSPLHPWGEVLFSAHMTQHEVLMLVAAPLLVLSRPLVPFLWALPARLRPTVGAVAKQRSVGSAWRALTNPLVAWGVLCGCGTFLPCFRLH
jgi:putative membrane protein